MAQKITRLAALARSLSGQGKGAGAMRLFALASLLPLGLLVLGLWQGGGFVLLLPLYMGVVIALFDHLVMRAAPFVPDADEFPAGDGLSVILALAHLISLPIVVWALAGGVTLGFWQKAALGIGYALWLGQVSNSNAHELIHRGARGLRALGVGVFVSIGYGHHASAHRLVHHRFVASPKDPNTARRGEGFYRFLTRAWIGELRAGLRAERALSAKKPGRRNPYGLYLLGALGMIALSAGLGGWQGVVVWLWLSIYAQAQLLLSDYVQHYGLQRAVLANGKLEAVAPWHSWDAKHWASSALMLNAPRHADHHAHPNRAYPALELPQAGLRLPKSLPVMACVALIPPLWFRVMNPRLPPKV